MNREDAKHLLKAELPAIIWKRDNSNKGYVCPICNSGSGPKGTGITTKPGKHNYTCWAGNCFTNADVFQVIGLQYGLNDFNEQFVKACELYGIEYETLEKDNNYYLKGSEPQTNQRSEAKTKTRRTVDEQREMTDFTEYFNECHKRLCESDYMQKRGISREVCDRFNIGYDATWKSPTAIKKGNNPPSSPRIIIPTSKYGYTARDTRTELGENQEGYKKMKEGPSEIFNLEYLIKEPGTIFLVEGEIDALSLIEVGAQAIALGSTNNVDKLIKHIKENLEEVKKAFILIGLDNDEAGNKARKKLEKGLYELGIAYCSVDTHKEYKDANELLQVNKEDFCDYIMLLESSAKPTDPAREYTDTLSIANYIDTFLDHIKETTTRKFISTGYKALDKELGGGIRPALYFIGAVSSLGKTTFCLNIADNIAKQGQDVLIFSLEMSKDELIAKSISKITHELDETTTGAKTSLEIIQGNKYAGYSQYEKDLISKAIIQYSEYAKNVFIYEGVGDIGIEEVKAQIEEHTSLTGNKPLVIIDYLQILKPYDTRSTDKQNTDKAVLDLKRIVRDYELPIICISSFNRDNYNNSVNLASFKESGAIEYTSDILIGLQYRGMDRKADEKEADYNKRIIELKEAENLNGKNGYAQHIQVKILKNRNGAKGVSAYFNYYPAYNRFIEEREGETLTYLQETKYNHTSKSIRI